MGLNICWIYAVFFQTVVISVLVEPLIISADTHTHTLSLLILSFCLLSLFSLSLDFVCFMSLRFTKFHTIFKVGIRGIQ